MSHYVLFIISGASCLLNGASCSFECGASCLWGKFYVGRVVFGASCPAPYGTVPGKLPCSIDSFIVWEILHQKINTILYHVYHNARLYPVNYKKHSYYTFVHLIDKITITS